MENKKIYLAQGEIEWHDCDPDRDVCAYYEEENAKAKIAEMIKKFKDYCANHGLEITWEQIADGGASIETAASDKFWAWIDSVTLY